MTFEISENEIRIDDGEKTIIIKDSGDYCCEYRYFTCLTDNLDYYADAHYIGYELGECGNEEDDEVHDINFLDVKTTLGVVSFCAHNVHNGYYGGFEIGEKQYNNSLGFLTEIEPSGMAG
jgi:hypothetical protein